MFRSLFRFILEALGVPKIARIDVVLDKPALATVWVGKYTVQFSIKSLSLLFVPNSGTKMELRVLKCFVASWAAATWEYPYDSKTEGDHRSKILLSL